MKAKTFKDIYIPNPCHENWGKMTPMEKGRFCQSCQRKVYDFRHSTIEEVNTIFKESKGAACGTFYDDEINQDLKYQDNGNTGLFRRWKLSTAATLAAIWLKLFSAEESYGQEPLTPTRDSIEATYNRSLKGEEKIIQGKLINRATLKGIGNIPILLKDKKNKTLSTAITDYEGNFKMVIPEIDLSSELALVIERQKVETYAKWIITPSVSKEINLASTEEIILETDLIVRKKPFKKERMIRTGRYRIN